MIPATKKYFTGLFFLIFFSSEAFAQYDSIVNRMQEEFDSFRKGMLTGALVTYLSNYKDEFITKLW